MAVVCRCVWMGASLVLAGLSSATALGAERTLPLKRVRLYESGVGYFERSGALAQGAVTLPVPASHLDDALKTLVVFSGDGRARVSGVEFASSVTRGVALALAGLESSAGGLGLLKLLEGLKGAEVEVTTQEGTFRGRVVEVLGEGASDLSDCVVRADDQRAGCTPEKQPVLVLMAKSGELRRVRAREIESVRPTDKAIVARLAAAVDSSSEASARVLKDMRVMAEGGGSISLGYVSETPVWRSSYRLVLADGAKERSMLQGWALVHNDTDEAWRGVTFELVNGRPDSFLFPLAAPRYARRELVTPDQPLSTVPQLLGTTPDSLWGPEEGEAYGWGGVGLSGTGEGGGGRGEGIGLGNFGIIGQGAGVGGGDSASSLLSVGNLAGIAAATGTESGALFRYELAAPLDLRAHGSALVPFTAQAIAARRVSLFEQPGDSARMAVHVVHEGSQTLPAGTLAVFGDGGFVGESALPRLKPQESTTVEYGLDLDVELEEASRKKTYDTQRLTFSSRSLVEHYVLRSVIGHRLENRSGSGRDVFLLLDFVNNAVARGADEIVYDARRLRAFAVFKVGPKVTVERTLTVDEGFQKEHPVDKLSSAILRRLGHERGLPEATRKIVLAALGVLLRAEADERLLRAHRATLAIREADVKRFREHARAVRAQDGAEAIAERLLNAEDRAEALRATVRKLAASAGALRKRAVDTLATIGR